MIFLLFFQKHLYEVVPLEHLPFIGGLLAKFMLSLRDENFKLLMSEATDRGITVQELIRAVIIPDWVKVNPVKAAGNGNGGKVRTFQTVDGRESIVQSMGRLRS